MDREQFYREIYDIVRASPPGRVATYGQIASLAGRPLCSRMVGQALHRAPASSRLPCHRVVNSQGRTVPAWPEQKILLENEGVAFRSNGYVDMRRSRWNPETE